jgi:cytochrome b561
MRTVSCYHPLLVAFHWLLAVVIIAVLPVGFLVLAPMPNTDPQKLQLLMFHMAGGMFILILMAIRFVVRMSTSRPPAVSTGYPLADRVAPITHYGFYLLVLLMAASGLTTALLAGLNRSVFQHSGEPLPTDFDIYPSMQVHGLVATLLALLIVLHVAAALYHQFVHHDSLFHRMWFGKR